MKKTGVDLISMTIIICFATKIIVTINALGHKTKSNNSIIPADTKLNFAKPTPKTPTYVTIETSAHSLIPKKRLPSNLLILIIRIQTILLTQ